MSNPSILYKNLFDIAVSNSLTADFTATDFDVNNVSDLRPYTLWKSSSTVTQYITIDTGTLLTDDPTSIPDTLVLMNTNLSSENVQLQTSTDNISFTSVTGLLVIPSKGISYTVFTGNNSRYWRLEIFTTTNPPFIGIMMLGKKLIFPQGVMKGLDPTSYNIKSTNQVSRRGQLLGSDISFKELNLLLRWDKLDVSFTDTEPTPSASLTFKDFWDNHASQLKPFIWVWNETLKPTEIYFVWLTGIVRKNFPYSVGTTHKNVTFNCRGIL